MKFLVTLLVLVAMSMPSVRLVCRCVDVFVSILSMGHDLYTKKDLDYTDLLFLSRILTTTHSISILSSSSPFF